MKVLMNEVLGPLALRVGTALAGVLVGAGASAEHADMVGVGAGALVLIGAELAIRYATQKWKR